MIKTRFYDIITQTKTRADTKSKQKKTGDEIVLDIVKRANLEIK